MGAETKQKQPGDKAEDGVIQPERKQQPSTCQVCQLQPHKYRCPGCQLQTCSLACSQQHKQQNGCSGKRDKLAFVPMSQFNDKHLMSDYRWLEEVSRADDNARRLRPPTPRRELPQHLASLVHQARLRGVRLLIMPPGMQRRQCNSTRYEFRARKLAWRLEWRFPAAAAAAAAGAPQAAAGSNTAQAAVAATADAAQPSADAQPSPAAAAAPSSSSSSSLRIVDGRVDEDALLCDVLGGHLQYQPGAGGQALLLRQHRQAGLGSLTVLMRKERCPANAVQYYQLDLQQCLKSQLAGKTVIEFPTLLVLLPSEVAAYSIITPEQQQAEQAAYRQGRQQLQHWPPPPPPPPRKPAAAGQQEQESAGALQTVGEQQQQQQEPPPAEGDEPPAKRQCNGSRSAADTVANSEQGAVQDKEPQSQQQQPQQQQQQQQQQVADIPSEEQQQEQPSQDQQQQQQQQPTYYYYDPADGVDEDAADLLAGLEDDDEEQQQQQVQVRQRAAAAAGGVVLGGEEGRAAMMQLLGQYDEHEIDLDE